MKQFTLNELEALELKYKNDHTVLELIQDVKDSLYYEKKPKFKGI